MGNEKEKDELSQIIINELKGLSSIQKETSMFLGEMDKKLDMHIQSTSYELKSLHAMDKEQNRLIDEHIAGVNTLKEMYQDHEIRDAQRFAQLGKPWEWIRTTLKFIVGSSAVVGFIYTLLNLLEKL